MLRRTTTLNFVAIASILTVACQPAAPGAPTVPTAQNSAAAKAGAPPAPAASPAAVKEPAQAAKAEPKAAAATRLTVATDNNLDSSDPYGHTDTVLYQFWCEVLGCLVGWDWQKGEPQPQLAESWKVESPTVWVFTLRKGVKWQDGTPFTSADVLSSLEQIKKHPMGRQIDRVRLMAKWEAPDDYTVRITTTEPSTGLMDRSFITGIAITQKRQIESGTDLTRTPAIGTGPYALKEWIPGQRAVVAKNPSWWGGANDGPGEVVYRVMKEPEVRLTALSSGEIQVAEVPPNLVERVTGNPNTKVLEGGSLTVMFLAMSPKYPPWDNKLLRQAVAYSVDRDSIIKNILRGYADKLEGPIGKGVYGYTPDVKPVYSPDLARAKQLVAEAGFPNGVDVELTSPVGNYPSDKEVAQAVAQMLAGVGIRTTVVTPENSARSQMLQDGKLSFYYQGRGSVRDPGLPLAQFLQTGATKRLQYSNPQLDALFKQEQSTFEDADRKRILVQIANLVQEEVPMFFLWRHKLLWGVTRNVEWVPRGDEAFYPHEIRLQ